MRFDAKKFSLFVIILIFVAGIAAFFYRNAASDSPAIRGEPMSISSTGAGVEHVSNLVRDGGRVLLLNDLTRYTFMTRPWNSVQNNEEFISNVTDYLLVG